MNQIEQNTKQQNNKYKSFSTALIKSFYSYYWNDFDNFFDNVFDISESKTDFKNI